MSRPRARAISVPSSVVTHERGTFRMVAGSIGANPPPGPMAPLEQAEPFITEPGSGGTASNDAWERELRQREAAAGVQEEIVERLANPPFIEETADMARLNLRPGAVHYVGKPPPLAGPAADLSSLPDKFSLEVERRPDGWWIITAPAVHIGLFVSDQDLGGALAEAPTVLAHIVRLDGVVPKQGRRKK